MSVDEKSTYYDQGGIETIEIIRAKLTAEKFTGFCAGNAIKYLCRMNFKTEAPDRDLEKAKTYMALLTESPEPESQPERKTKIPPRPKKAGRDK